MLGAAWKQSISCHSVHTASTMAARRAIKKRNDLTHKQKHKLIKEVETLTAKELAENTCGKTQVYKVLMYKAAIIRAVKAMLPTIFVDLSNSRKSL